MLKGFMKKFIYSVVLLVLSIPVFAKNNEFGILCYHNVVDESIKHKKQKYYPQTISEQTLIMHFNWLRNNGYTPVSLQQIFDARNGGKALPDKAVLLTFDDGYESFYSVIYPLLKAYNYPAVYGIVTDWANTPENKKIVFGNEKLSRDEFVTWQQLREMQESGLVEMASHTNDLHHGITANSAGSSLPGVIAAEYKNGKYETRAQYENRLRRDFQRSYDLLKKNTGAAPRAIIWPYGQFTDKAADIAKEVGFDVHMSLVEARVNTPEQEHWGRLLLDTETSIETIANYLNHKNTGSAVQRAIRVKLDDVYDPDPKKQSRNLDKLIERIHRYGITTVYLQAFSDLDNDGVAEALYFKNKYLPVRADLFGRVAWILETRLGISAYAWMPLLAFDLKGINENYIKDNQTGEPDSSRYLRLSPYDSHNLEIIKSIYSDLSFYNKFDGILFHHDAFLTNSEGNTDDYHEGQVGPAVKQKTQDLLKITDELKEVVYPYVLDGRKGFKTARGIYASLITQPESEEWFAQNLEEFTKHYSTIVVLAMPYMEHQEDISPREARKWVDNLAKDTLSRVPADKVLFELQTVNRRTRKAIADDELIDWIDDLQERKLYNIGFYPDNFQLDQPSLHKVKPHFSTNRNAGLK